MRIYTKDDFIFDAETKEEIDIEQWITESHENVDKALMDMWAEYNEWKDDKLDSIKEKALLVQKWIYKKTDSFLRIFLPKAFWLGNTLGALNNVVVRELENMDIPEYYRSQHPEWFIKGMGWEKKEEETT